jgi:PAS domain S-box-containing protein
LSLIADRFGPRVLEALVESSLDGVVIVVDRWTVAHANPAACQILGRAPGDVVGRSFLEFVAPRERDAQRARSNANSPGVFETVLVRPGGEERLVQYSTELLPAAGPDASFAVVRDVTDLRRLERERLELSVQNALLHERAERRHLELATLLGASRDAAQGLELRPLLELILDRLGAVVPYAAAAVFTLDSAAALDLIAYRGPLAWASLTRRWDLGSAAHSREVVEGRRPVVIPDVTADTPLARAFRGVAEAQLGRVPDYIGAWMGVPLVVRDRVIGVLAFDHGEAGFYTPERVRLAEAFAQQAAVAIDIARLLEASRDRAALEERQRLARELHDSVSQALYGIALGARASLRALERDPAGARAPIEYVLSLAEAGLAEMRALIFELRPESLEQEGLVAALAKQAAAARSRFELGVDVSFGEEPDLPLATKEALYRIAQEALHNTVKHARASRVSIRLETGEGTVVLEVSDDGVGFDAGRDYPGHLGQRSMRERAELAGAALAVESAPGRGTRVRVTLGAPRP